MFNRTNHQRVVQQRIYSPRQREHMLDLFLQAITHSHQRVIKSISQKATNLQSNAWKPGGTRTGRRYGLTILHTPGETSKTYPWIFDHSLDALRCKVDNLEDVFG